MKSASRKRRHTMLPHAALLLSFPIYRDSRGRFAVAFAPARLSSNRCETRLQVFGTKRPRTIDSDLSHLQPTDGEMQLSNKGKSYNFSPLPDFMQKDPTLLTDKRILQRKLDELKEKEFSTAQSSKENSMKMMAMSAVSIGLAISVIYSLASSTPDVSMLTDSMPDVATFESSEESRTALKELLIDRSEVSAEVSRLGIATRQIAQTVLPQSADDVIAVSIGEGIAGAIGAVATWILGMLLKFRGGGLDQLLELSEMERQKAMMRGELVTEAVADGDYFLTRAAAQPLFEAVGLPIFLASLASILVATVPYEAIKLSSQRQREKEKEEVLLEILLKEEAVRQENMNIVDKMSIGMGDLLNRLNVRAQMDDGDEFSDEAMQRALMEEQKQRLEDVKNSAPKLDYVEFFADLTKWLEYDVLISNYRGILSLPNGQMIGPGWESAIFGLLAALSSQLYTDVLYIYSDFGNPEKREKTLNRPLEVSASIYTTKCLSAATLFGTYEALRAPISKLCSQIISGGYTGCVGSKDFDLCMETYLIENPPEASFQAVFRAFVVSVMNWFDNLASFLPWNDQASLVSDARGAIVALYSLLDSILSA